MEGSTSDSSSDLYSKLCKDRQYIRARVTRIHNQVTNQYEYESLTPRKKTDLIEKLHELKEKLITVNERIHSVLPATVVEDELIEQEEEYEDKISTALSVLVVAEIPLSPGLAQNNLPNANKLKLPTVSLPEFSNEKGDSLEKFLFSFESIIGKHGLSEYEKFIYLKGQLHKGPLALINSLEPAEQTYDSAKSLLTQAFACPLTQKYKAIKRLCELKLKRSDDVYTFISDMRMTVSLFKSLEIDVNTVIQYFVWHGMNELFQSQLVNLTNKSKPSLEEINSQIFSAAERYLKVQDQSHNKFNTKSHFPSTSSRYAASRDNFGSKVETNNLALGVSKKPLRECMLCVSDNRRQINHVLKDCKVYPNPRDKIKKLDQLKYCSKCSFKNHVQSQCRFKFKSSCRKCSKNHLTCLCPNMVNGGGLTENVASKASVVHCISSSRKDNVILPTFTIEIGENSNRYKCRVLHDTGSQRNFIRKQVAERLNLPVVDSNVDVVIQGINSERVIPTCVVKVPMQLKEISHYIDAIVLPNIDVKLSVADLNIVAKAFTSRGYILADEYLISSSLSNSVDFDLIMGPDAVKLLRPQTVAYGVEPNISVYMQSQVGVMLIGDSQELLANADSLPKFNDSASFKCSRPDSQVTIAQAATDSKFNINSMCDVLDETGEVVKSQLKKATDEVLQFHTRQLMNYDDTVDGDCSIENEKVVNYVLDNCECNDEGRFVMPLPWNPSCKHLLGTNFILSKQILFSNLKQLNRDNKLAMYNEVFREQESLGIIQRIEDVTGYINQHPDCSFLPHMGVYRMARETTKVRIVYLSNLCEKNDDQPNAVSHNNALLPGPCLNSKISTAVLRARFDHYILTFDISKAFLNIELKERDQNKLLCLWFKNVDAKDFTIIAYKNLRLPFGLRPSPTILMLALYQMLIIETDDDSPELVKLKKLIYANMYVDNGIVSANDHATLTSYYEQLPIIFSSHKFALQQFASNDQNLQQTIDESSTCPTSVNLSFFGMTWNRESDTFGPHEIKLDPIAGTKREVLATLNAVYDIFGIYIPVLNRAKLFFQHLQCDKTLGWDTPLREELFTEWRRICKQANSVPQLSVNREMGSRDGSFTLVAFSDASAAMYGAAVYLVDNLTKRVSFVLAKNKVISNKMSQKTIPSLECQGVAYAAEILIDLFRELCGSKTVCPLVITDLYVYTDSMVSLSWIRSYFINHDKMQKRSVFVLNRLKQISDTCAHHTITFRYVEGRENPADCVTRPLSYNMLKKTCYLAGPNFLSVTTNQPDIQVTVPNPVCSDGPECSGSALYSTQCAALETLVCLTQPVVEPSRYSSFQKLVRVLKFVLKFIHKLKCKANKSTEESEVNLYAMASNHVIKADQARYFPKVVEFFSLRKVSSSNIPNLILQMNLFQDENKIIRVKGKFKTSITCPILLHDKSLLTELIIKDLHQRVSHSGIYVVLKELRNRFWVLKGFATVRKILKQCIICKKRNERPIKLNQSCYRDFRSSPPQVPFSSVFIDYIGPINVRVPEGVKKVWLLIITCLWSRAISLKICLSADTEEFLYSMQMHIYEFGLFQHCMSDLGSQIVTGTRIIADFLDDIHCKEFFEQHGSKSLTFEHYAKGNSSLGSLVEVCVKQTKFLITKSIGKVILKFRDFQLLVCKTQHIVNRRPIAFQTVLRQQDVMEELPTPITPEALLFGRDLMSVNVLPQLQPGALDEVDESSTDLIRSESNKLHQVFMKLNKLYHEEFLVQLLSQAIDKRDRYTPVYHQVLAPGDIVLLVEPLTKQTNYPLGIVKRVTKNELGEVTSAEVLKGRTREVVYRHASSLILLLHASPDSNEASDVSNSVESSNSGSSNLVHDIPERPLRRAADVAKTKISNQYHQNTV